ncbi:MAG: hypothetical protein ACREMV_11735 [Gemmatimonadales bacterium]
MTPNIHKLKPTVYIEAVPELMDERGRAVEELAKRARELPRSHRVAAGLVLTTIAVGLRAIA